MPVDAQTRREIFYVFTLRLTVGFAFQFVDGNVAAYRLCRDLTSLELSDCSGAVDACQTTPALRQGREPARGAGEGREILTGMMLRTSSLGSRVTVGQRVFACLPVKRGLTSSAASAWHR